MNITQNHIEKAQFDSSFPYVNVFDWFTYTWLCSYQRFVSARIDSDFTLIDFLISIQKNDPSNPHYSVDEWLVNCEIVTIDKLEVEKYISIAKSDFEEEKGNKYSNVEGVDFPLKEGFPSKIDEAIMLKGNKSPCNKHSAGPTHIIAWRDWEWLYYLEIHNES